MFRAKLIWLRVVSELENLPIAVTFQNDTELIPTHDSAVKPFLVQRWAQFSPESSSQMFNKRPFLEQSEKNPWARAKTRTEHCAPISSNFTSLIPSH